MKTRREIKEEIESCSSDLELWKYLIENKDEDLPSVILDNYDTSLRYSYEDEWYFSFPEDFVGSSNDVTSLLKAIGFKSDYC